jgi:hypothetical protein
MSARTLIRGIAALHRMDDHPVHHPVTGKIAASRLCAVIADHRPPTADH